MTIATQRGYSFEKEIDLTLVELWDYHFKIPDARTMQGFNMPFAPKVPADFCGHKSGRFQLLECKQTKMKSLPFDRLAPHQLDALLSADKSGGEAWLCVSFNNRERKKELRIDRVFLLPIREFMHIKSHSERKSLSMDACIENGIELILHHENKQRIWRI
jgi:penicillin-binding protein-related factor A (putative recombinase)